MDYYEELGIQPNATEEEIRKAHRRLTKLLHPDQQTDEAVKQLAETQMRRLNSIVEILYDPERRRIYDEHLREGLIPFGPGAVAVRAAPKRRSSLRALPWWIASTVGAIALTVGAVWFWADNWGSSFANRNPVYVPSEATASGSPRASGQQAQTDPPQPTSTSSTAAAQPPATVQVEKHRGAFSRIRDAVLPPHRESATREEARAKPESRTEQPPAKTNSQTVTAVPPPAPVRKTLVLADNAVRVNPRPAKLQIAPPPNVPTSPASHVDPAVIPGNTLPPATSKPPQPPPAAPVKTNTAALVAAAMPAVPTRHNPLEGEWVYAPAQPEKNKPGFYPPEFIDLHLFWNEGGLHGTYRARYQVGDKPIPPDVAFALAPNGTNKFLWQANNGSRGTLKISAIDPSSIRIEWKTTVYSRGLALTAGTATLMRRTQ